MNQSMQQMQKMFEPARKMSTLMLDHAEKIMHLNLDAARAYNNLATEQVRNALAIRDLESLQACLNSQGKVMQTVSSKLSEDANTLADLSKNMGEEVQKIARENVTVLTESVRNQQNKGAQQQEEKKSRSGTARSDSAANSSTSGTGASAKKSA
ncbi:phasin family protein [Halorhodospira abdelmalekii]|uniref:phasin family protein n=1 Tax=Halorhodospira abdelmalekii TaxID=421629 RepID=UPI001F5B8B45|nr:phasin family protein [Halorhodospira abdelmalekii]